MFFFVGIVQEIFHGMFKSRVKCPHRECQHTSVVFDPFMYLSLPLSSLTTSTTSSGLNHLRSSRGIGSGKTITLQQALDNFTAEEELGEDNEWYCPNCKKQRCAYKKLDIWRLPEV